MDSKKLSWTHKNHTLHQAYSAYIVIPRGGERHGYVTRAMHGSPSVWTLQYSLNGVDSETLGPFFTVEQAQKQAEKHFKEIESRKLSETNENQKET